MVTADIAENDLVKLLKEFCIFERNKIPLEIKLTAIAMYLSSSQRIALLFNVGKSSVHYWIEKFKDTLEFNNKEKIRKLLIARIAVDETVLKYNGKMLSLCSARC